MNVIEIFSELSTHMIGGMMFHEELMNSYRFLALPGYAKYQEYRYLEETIAHTRLVKFAVDRYDFLVPPGRPDDPALIPESWYFGKKRQSLTISDKVAAIATSFSEWVRWESDTLRLFKLAYQNLIDLNEVDAAEFIKDYVVDVSNELIDAKNERLAKESMDYDMPSIIEEQKAYEKRFTKKLRKLKGV